ncbi:MAG: DNA polymerase IV [Gammaproteobacteria bacterium]|nr:DNA polymerase IV [Gammaproteobacteria bacterium]
MRKIIHIDMDAFFASVEQRDHPELIGKPVAVGGSRKRGVVAAASYEARKFGVYSAMPSVTARKKCPELIFVKPRFDVYKSVSRQIHGIFQQYTDLIEPLSLDEAYLDVSENKKGLPTATDVASEIKQAIHRSTGLTASAGVSINKFLAKIASDYDKPDGLFVITPNRAQQFIDRLPIEKFFGVGKVTASKMKSLGIRNGAELKQWSLEELVSLFGKSGHYFFDVANGQDNRPVVAHRERKSIGAETTFIEDQTSLDRLIESLQGIAQEVTRRVSSQQSAGRTVTLKIKFANFTQITRSHSMLTPVNDYQSIFSTAHYLLNEAFGEGMSVRLLGITLSNLDKKNCADTQLTLRF